MEKILSVEEVTFKGDKYYGFDGIKVVTDKHVYEAGICNSQQCCEDWGYMINEDNDDYEEFVGAILHSVTSDGCFTNFNTDRGTLNFTAYNEHNGYYNHKCVLRKDGVVEQSVYI